MTTNDDEQTQTQMPPLSDARLAAIRRTGDAYRAMAVEVPSLLTGAMEMYLHDTADLLAEVARLRHENAGLQRRTEEATTYHADLMWRYHRLREIVTAVAELREPRTDARHTWDCSFCGTYLIAHDHEASCPVLKASALLASSGEGETTDESEVSER